MSTPASPPSSVRRCVVFSGRVQGVGFRATAAAIAQRRPVTGFVRNEPDGSVRLEVQGGRADVDAVLDEVRRTMGAMIRDERAADAAPRDGERGFEIRRSAALGE